MKKAVVAAIILCAGLAIAAIAKYRIGDTCANTLKEPPIGKPAPAFTLTDTKGKQHNLADFKANTWCWSGSTSRATCPRPAGTRRSPTGRWPPPRC